MQEEIKNDELGFEERLIKAKEILEKLSKSEITLNDSMKLYNEGIKELEIAQKLLEDAKTKFTTINKD